MSHLIKALFALALAAAAACTTATGTGERRQAFVMRHLEAEADGGDPGLTAEGAANARRLASWFKGRDAPRTILVSRYRRAQETAAPLAAMLGLTPQIYDPRQTDAMIASAAAAPGPILIVGHSNTVPDIVERLGGTRPEPIAHDQYGDIWRIAGKARTTTRLKLEEKR